MQLLGSNYQSTLLKYVDEQNLPEYLGGSSKATLLDDAGPWQDTELIAEIDAEYKAAMAEDTSRKVDADATISGESQHRLHPATALSASVELH